VQACHKFRTIAEDVQQKLSQHLNFIHSGKEDKKKLHDTVRALPSPLLALLVAHALMLFSPKWASSRRP
jgi:hypothetical protein